VGTPFDALGVLLCGFVLYWAGRSILDERFGTGAFIKRVAKARSSTVAEAREGRVRLEGRAEKHKLLLTSPGHEQPCLAFRLEVERIIGEYTKQPTWQLIYTDSKMVPFILRDDTGEALIEADPRVICELQSEATIEQGLLGSLPPHLRQLLKKEGIQLKGLILNKSLKVLERRLDVGEPCTVVGEVSHLEATDGPETYRSASSRPVIGAGEGRLALSDLRVRDILRPHRLRLFTFGSLGGAAVVGALVFGARLFGWL
jgi:hypothetical protein